MKRKTQVTWYGDEYAKIVGENGDEAMFAAGEIVQRVAEAKAPQGRTGNLRRSGYVSTAKRSTYQRRPYWRKEKKPPQNAVTVAFSAPHAHLMESGRRKAGPLMPRGSVMYGGRVYRNNGNYRKALRIDGQYRSHSRYRRMSAHPFLGPAIDDTRETMVQEIAKVLNKALESGMRE